MNTREENVAAAMPEADEIAEKERIRRAHLQWAQEWQEGHARCPSCGGTDFGIPDAKYEDHARYESFSCLSCSTRWKVELSETALSVIREDEVDDDWVDLETFDESPPVHLSEREQATTLAALRYWRRERLSSAGHERDIETDFDRLKALSTEEIDALCDRIKRSTGDRPHSAQSDLGGQS